MKYSCALLIAAACTSPAAAQTYTDLDKKVAALVAAAGPLPVTVHYKVAGTPYQECETYYRPGPMSDIPHERCATITPSSDASRVDQITPTFSNITVSFPDPPVLGPVTYQNFPDQFVESSEDMVNCSSLTNSVDIGLTLAASRNTSVTLTKSVTHSQGVTVGASGSMFGVGVSASVNVSNSSTTATATSSGATGGYTITGGGHISLPPKTRVVALLRSYKIEAAMPFVVHGTVDADINGNDKGYKRLSDYISADQRTVEIDGTIISDDDSKGEFRTQDAAIDSSVCPAGSNQVVTAVNPQLSGLTLFKSKAKIKNIVISKTPL